MQENFWKYVRVQSPDTLVVYEIIYIYNKLLSYTFPVIFDIIISSVSVNSLVPSAYKNSRIRRDHRKNSYERRDYELVDEKSLS